MTTILTKNGNFIYIKLPFFVALQLFQRLVKIKFCLRIVILIYETASFEYLANII